VRTTYTGEEAVKARAEAEARHRFLDRYQKALDTGVPERNKILLFVCRMCPEGVGKPELEGFNPEDPQDLEILSTFARWYNLPAQEAFWIGEYLGEALGRHKKACEIRAAGGNRSPEDTRTPSIKSKLITQYLQRQKDASFAAYWGALCEPAAWIREFLDSWGVVHRGEKGGVVTLWSETKTLAIRKDSHGRLFRRLKRKSGQMTRKDPPPFGR